MSPIVSNETVAHAPVSTEPDVPKLIKEPARFTFHTVGITLCGVLALVLPSLISGVLLLFFVLLSASGEWLRCSERIQGWPAWTILGPLARAANSIGVRQHEIGTRSATLDFFVGLTLVWGLCPPEVVAASCFITAWADPLARVVGKNWGSRNWPGSKKTLEGSLTCWFVASAACFIILAFESGVVPSALAVAIIVGVATTIAELVPQYPGNPKPGDILTPADNFWLVIISAMTLMACKSWLL